MKTKLISFICALAFATAGMAQSTSVAAYTTNTLECLGTELDGSQTIRVSGIGRTRANSREQCRKNAVWAVIFKGVTGGIGNCNMRPLINEPNAEEKYEDYFNAFFTDKGEYLNYCSMEDNKKFSQKKAKAKTHANYTYTVRVLRPKLRQKLIEDGVLKTK